MIKTDEQLIWETYLNEGKLSGALKTGALAGAMALGGATATVPQDTMGTTTQQAAYQDLQVLNVPTFIDLWSKYYQTSRDPKKEKNAHELLEEELDIPNDAQDAIKVAVYIFGGDMGVSSNVLEDLLKMTGWVESLRYTTKKQFKHPTTGKHGPARGYWQVEPETAIDLVVNSRALFGPKFRAVFGEEKTNRILLLRKGNQRDYEWIRDELEKDVNLAAAFAAAKWIVSGHRALRDIKNR